MGCWGNSSIEKQRGIVQDEISQAEAEIPRQEDALEVRTPDGDRWAKKGRRPTSRHIIVREQARAGESVKGGSFTKRGQIPERREGKRTPSVVFGGGPLTLSWRRGRGTLQKKVLYKKDTAIKLKISLTLWTEENEAQEEPRRQVRREKQLQGSGATT